MINRIFMLFYFLLMIINCKAQGDNHKKNEILENILIEQLKRGKRPTEYNNYNSGKKELEAIIPILKNELTINGFKFQTKEIFNKKVKSIFNRIILPTSETKYLYVNLIEKCQRDNIYSPNDKADVNGFFIIKENNFITDFYEIPEIYDYQKNKPQLNKYEVEKIFIKDEVENTNLEIPHWKDIPNLKEIRKKNIQTLVARNMYLFNNSRAHFRWLIVNDEYFMRSLVTTFGYTDDAELLEWVVEKINFNDTSELDKLFYNPKCDGTTQLNTAVFSALKKYITPKNKIVLEQLQKYLVKLTDLKNECTGLHFKERTELIARLSYFGELYRFKPEFEYDNYNNNYFIICIFTYDFGHKFKTEMKEKNYYGLPDFMKLYDKADKDYGEYYWKFR
ncbi:MAG: hypothetical protein QM535_09800 [Limnohabitans sp.]|nr:hypothetical protein [Limnohabitans sp.]